MNVDELVELIWDVDYDRKSIESKTVRKAFDEASYETWVEALKEYGSVPGEYNVKESFKGSKKYPIQRYIQDRWPEVATYIKKLDKIPEDSKDLTLIDDKEDAPIMEYTDDEDVSPAVKNKWYFHSPEQISKSQVKDWLEYSRDPENLAKLAAEQGGDEPLFDPDNPYEGLNKEDKEFIKGLKYKDLLDKKTRDSYNKIASKKDSGLMPLDGKKVRDIQFYGNHPGKFEFDNKGTVRTLLKSLENWQDDTAPSRSVDPLEIEVNRMSPEELYKYLEENYPDESKEEQLEDLAEKEPEKAIANEDVIPNTAKEAKQTLDSNPHNDEANNEEIKKDIGKKFTTPQTMLNGGYEDGLLKRSEEQQEEFDRIKEESEREAAEWRAQQAAAKANRAANAANSTPNPAESAPQIGEQPIENKPLTDDDVENEMKRFEGSKKRSTKRLTDIDSNPLESLEFNPTEFNKQYEIDHPELKIKDELTDDERNDIDYKPSQEELDALNAANREEWEANGRPRNKDLPDKTIDLPNDFMDKEVERQIEDNPSKAAEVASPNSPIEQEADQIGDGDKRTDEVNNAEIEKVSTQEKADFLNEMESPDFGANLGGANMNGVGSQLTPNQVYNQELNAPNDELGNVVDYGLEDRNNYGDNQHDWAPLQQQNNARQETMNQIQDQMMNSDNTIAMEQPDPSLPIKKLSEAELRQIFDPLDKEIKAREVALAKAEDNLDLAQRHFDEDPSEKNAEALNKASQVYDDAEFLLNKKKDEYADAYKNAGNYYKQSEEEEESAEFNMPKLPLNARPQDIAGHPQHATSSNIKADIPTNKGFTVGTGPRAGLPMGSMGSMGGSAPNAASISNKPISDNKPTTNGTGSVGVPIQSEKNTTVSAPSYSNGQVTSNGGGVGSGATKSNGGSLIVKPYSLPNGEANNQADLFAGGGTSGGSSNGGGLRDSYIAQLEQRIKSIPEGLAEELGFTIKYKHVEYQQTPLEECSGGQLQEIESILTDLGI